MPSTTGTYNILHMNTRLPDAKLFEPYDNFDETSPTKQNVTF